MMSGAFGEILIFLLVVFFMFRVRSIKVLFVFVNIKEDELYERYISSPHDLLNILLGTIFAMQYAWKRFIQIQVPSNFLFFFINSNIF